MWRARREAVDRGERVAVLRGGAPVSFEAALHALTGDADFRAFLLAELAAAPFPAFFWEMPPVALPEIDRSFEYVTIAAPGLCAALADPRAFAAELAAGPASETVASFADLSGDATLVAPRPLGPPDAYAHLAVFLRGAPPAQQHDLLALTAVRARQALSDRPLWISTAGLGVFWLHVRLDSRPKYYSHAPYRAWNPRPLARRRPSPV